MIIIANLSRLYLTTVGVMDKSLIETLADGQFHSGQVLGKLLGVSRTAVWKHLKKLEEYGVSLESVKGRGYRIPGGLELLDEVAIRKHISIFVAGLVGEMGIFQTLESTNKYISDQGLFGDHAVCLAEHQITGRGRRGRSWTSPFGRNIYMSLGWRFEGGAASLEGLSLVVGIAVRRALGGDDHIKLKWPNDLLYDGRKLAGILIEMHGDPSGDCQVVIGIGMNVGMVTAQGIDIDQPWADVREFSTVSRNTLVANILNELVPLLNSFDEGGFERYRDEWNGCDAFMNAPVRLTTPALEQEGIERGVANNGAIRIEVDGEIVRYSGGELSLRLVS